MNAFPLSRAAVLAGLASSFFGMKAIAVSTPSPRTATASKLCTYLLNEYAKSTKYHSISGYDNLDGTFGRATPGSQYKVETAECDPVSGTALIDRFTFQSYVTLDGDKTVQWKERNIRFTDTYQVLEDGRIRVRKKEEWYSDPASSGESESILDDVPESEINRLVVEEYVDDSKGEKSCVHPATKGLHKCLRQVFIFRQKDATAERRFWAHKIYLLDESGKVVLTHAFAKPRLWWTTSPEEALGLQQPSIPGELLHAFETASVPKSH